MSSVKSGGSSKNGRDSQSKRLGAKLADGQFALAGSIIYRQRGTKIHPGANVGLGNDFTLYMLIDGFVKYETRRGRKYALVLEKKEETKPNKAAAKKPAVKKAETKTAEAKPVKTEAPAKETTK